MPFVVSARTVVEPAGVDTAAIAESATPAVAPATGVEVSTAAETGVCAEVSTVASTEAAGVDTSTAALVPPLEASILTDAGPRSTEIETPGLFDPAAALCAPTASPTSATATKATRTRICAVADTRKMHLSASLDRGFLRRDRLIQPARR